jgi:hypothetical protein
MVTIIGYRLAKNKDEKEFIALELQSDLDLVQSMGTGNFYATARRCSITSTFNEETAKSLIGKQLPGSIKRVESDAYDFVIPNTGEVVKLQHTYQYSPEEANEVVPSATRPRNFFSLKGSMA